MKTILIDDEIFSLQYLTELCMQIPELEICGQFQNAADALAWLRDNRTDLVLTDIEMPGLNGLDAAGRIQQLCPEAGIIFVTGYEEYALKAFKMEAISYLLKPCTLSELKSAIGRAQKLLPPPKKRIMIRTFGTFSVIVDGNPLHFSNSKARELLALLVDRQGGVLTMEQAVDILWESRTYDDMVKRLYRKAVSYLHQLFQEHHLHFFVSNRGCCHVLPEETDCDYYRFLKGDHEAVMNYNGEYMSDYSWAELTNGKLNTIYHKNTSLT